MSNVKEELTRGLEVAARGELSLDKSRARDKLRMFRLPDPHFYVLQYVRAASVLGAGEIRFEFGVGGMSCAFDATIPAWGFDNFWDAGFRARQSREDIALHNLALGIGSAQALTPGSISVTSGERKITFYEDHEVVTNVSKVNGTVIKMRERFRVGHMLDFFTEHAELLALREHCMFARIRITVQGDTLKPPPGFHRTPLNNEQGFVQLAQSDTRTTEFYVLQDDVCVERVTFPSRGLPALGWLNSNKLATDLSGLKLADPDATMPRALGVLYDAYHHALLQWAERGPPDPSTNRTIGIALLHHMAHLRERGASIPPRTQALLDWWVALPMFRHATGESTEDVPLSTFFGQGDVVRVATRMFPEVASREPVLHVVPGVRGLDQLLADAGFEVEDRTKSLEDEAVRQRNREIHDDAPFVENVAPASYKRSIELGYGTVHLLVPDVDDEALKPGGLLYSYGKLVRRVPPKLPIVAVVNGALSVDFVNLDLARDEKLEALAEAMLEQTDAFLNIVGHAVIKAPTEERRAMLSALIHAVLNETYESNLLQMLGFEGETLAQLMLKVKLWGEMSDELLDRLGAAADAPLFQLFPEGFASLREVITWEVPPIVATVDLEGVSILQDAGENVLMLSNRDARLIGGLREIRHAYNAVVEMTRRNAFFSKPPFTHTPHESALRRRSQTSITPYGELNTQIELIGVGSSADLLILAHDRLVTMRSIASEVGQMRVVVRSDDWTLAPDFGDIVEDELYETVSDTIEVLARELSDQMVLDACARMSVTPAELEYVWWRARDGASTSLLPAFVFDDGAWTPISITLHEARRRVGADGRLIHVTSRDTFKAELERPGATVFRVPQSPVDYTVMFPGGRLVQLDVRVDDSQTAMSQYFQRARFASPLSREMPRWTLTSFGFQFEGSIDVHDNRHRHRVHIVWEGRELEMITLESKFGSFQTVVQGPSVEPDPGFRYLATGRTEMLEAARSGPERLVREVCRQMTANPFGDLLELEPARRWLLGYLIAQHRAEFPVDFYPVLRATPLFPIQGGRRVTYDALAMLATEGTLSWSERADPRAVLHFSKSQMRMYESAVAPDFVLMHVNEMEFALDRGPAPPQYNNDLVLNDVATILVDARGDRRHLFDDRLALSLRWTPTSAAACQVHANGVVLSKAHPLVQHALAAGPGSVAMQFLSSVVYSAVNNYYQEIVDHDELELQANLLARARRLQEATDQTDRPGAEP